MYDNCMHTLLFTESIEIVLVILIMILLNPKYIHYWLFALSVFMFFYRLPHRQLDTDKAFVHAPSDGTILDIVQVNDYTQIKIYLSIFNVHVQWVPVDGCVIQVKHKPGEFNLAHVLEKSDFNERMSTLFLTPTGHHIQVDQIAGQVARRIVNWCTPGKSVTKGDLMGMIKLSSRVDIFVPTDQVTILVNKTDVVHGGVSRIAKWN